MKSKVFQMRQHSFYSFLFSDNLNTEKTFRPLLEKCNSADSIAGDTESPYLRCFYSGPCLSLKEMLYAVQSQEVLGHFLSSFKGWEKQQRQKQCEHQSMGRCMTH